MSTLTLSSDTYVSPHIRQKPQTRWFGVRRTVVVYDTAISNMGGEVYAKRPRYFPETVVTAVLADADIVPVLNETYMEGMGMGLHRYYRRGINTDKYISPAPAGKTFVNNISDEAVQKLIPEADLIETSKNGYFDIDLPGYVYASQNFGYSDELGTCLFPPEGAEEDWELGVQANDDNTEITLCFFDPEAYDNISEETPFEPLIVNTGIPYTEPQQSTEDIWIQVIYRTKLATINHGTVTERFPATLESVNDTWEETDYIVNEDLTYSIYSIIIQEYQDNGELVRKTTTIENIYTPMQYFEYLVGSGDEELDSLVTMEEMSDLFPTVCFRREKENLFDDKHTSSEYYLKSKKLLKQVPINIDDMWDSIAEQDLGDVRWVYFTPGVPSNTVQQMSYRYYFDFFTEMLEHSTGKKAEELNGIKTKISNISYVHNGLTIFYTFGSVLREEFEGSVGKLRKYNMTFDGTDTVITWQNTASTYIKITVGASAMNMPLKGGKSTTGFMHQGTDKEKIKFFLPLSYKAKKRMGLWNFTQLTTDCLMVVFQCYEVIKKSFFSWVLELVLAPINVVFSFVIKLSDAAFSWMADIAFPVGNLMMFLKKHAEDLIDKLLVFGLTFAEKILGAKLTMIVAVAVVVILTIYGAGTIAASIIPYLINRSYTAQGAAIAKKSAEELSELERLQKEQNEFLKDADEGYRVMDNVVAKAQAMTRYSQFQTAEEFLYSITGLTDMFSSLIAEIVNAGDNLIMLPTGLIADQDPRVQGMLADMKKYSIV